MAYAKHGNLERTYPAESTYYLTEQIAIACILIKKTKYLPS